MAGNSNLHMSRAGKTDEFYTTIELIEKELKHYRSYFKDKIVFCNCDDPAHSNFFKYFQANFYFLGLKKLITTHYEAEKVSYKLEIVNQEADKDGQYHLPEYIQTPLKQNGDFRSPECIEILKEADVVVTNPPFSLFREYLGQLVEYKKDFIIIGNQNSVCLGDIFPLIKDNKIWLGYMSGHFWFMVPDDYEEKKTDFKIDANGQKWRRMGNICWFTNIDIEKRHEDMILFRNYNSIDYPKYDNYNAIEVSRTADIPCDYYDVMGVPITFMDKYNPEQFEIVGQTHISDTTEETEALRTDKRYRHRGRINGKEKYARILIRRKRHED